MKKPKRSWKRTPSSVLLRLAAQAFRASRKRACGGEKRRAQKVFAREAGVAWACREMWKRDPLEPLPLLD